MTMCTKGSKNFDPPAKSEQGTRRAPTDCEHTSKLIFKLGPVVEVLILLLIVVEHHFAFVGVHHMPLHSMKRGKLARLGIIASHVQGHMTILQLGALHTK